MSKICNSCNDVNVVTMSGANWDASEARHERREKRYIIALIVSIALMFASNCAWLYAWMQYDYSSEQTVVDVNSEDGGNANYIGNDGDIVNGEDNR